jgi:hypothetical protein
MARKKYPKPQPIERMTIYQGIMPIVIEVWNNPADSGERGSWKQRKAGDALNILIEVYADKLLNPLNPPNVSDITLRRLLSKRQTLNLVDDIKSVLRRKNISFGKTALWLLAKELQNTFVALRNATINNQANLGHLPIDSPEYILRQKLLKGTF